MKIIQLTDTHLVPSGSIINGVDPEKQLRLAIDDIVNNQADADLLVITGDLCNFGEPEAYELLHDILAPVCCEIRLMLGNHDRRPEFIKAFPAQPRDTNGYIQSYLDTEFGRLLFLDSHQAGVIGGVYGQDRLEWFEAALAGGGEQPVVVFVHHPPFDCGIAHFERIGMHDDGAIMKRLSAYPAGTRHIVFGHIHVPLSGTSIEGIAFSSGLACSHRFITDLEDPAPLWTSGNPCYRIIKLDDNGFRAYSVDVGQIPTERTVICKGP